MTHQQEIFCLEYIKSRNATQAAIKAGYSERSARVTGARLLTYADISKYINKKLDETKKKLQLTEEKVLDEIRKLAFSDLKDYVNGGNNILEIKGLSNEKTAAIQGIKIEERTIKGQTIVNQEIKLYNKLDALEKLAKHLGLYERDNRQKAAIKVGFADDEDD